MLHTCSAPCLLLTVPPCRYSTMGWDEMKWRSQERTVRKGRPIADVAAAACMHACMYVCVYSCMRVCVACNCNLVYWATVLLACVCVGECGQVSWDGWMGGRLAAMLLLLLLLI